MTTVTEALNKIPVPSKEIKSIARRLETYLETIESLHGMGIAHQTIANHLVDMGILTSFATYKTTLARLRQKSRCSTRAILPTIQEQTSPPQSQPVHAKESGIPSGTDQRNLAGLAKRHQEMYEHQKQIQARANRRVVEYTGPLFPIKSDAQ